MGAAGSALLMALAVASPAAAAPDFSVSVDPPGQFLPPGGSIAFLVSVGSLGGFANEVTLTVGNLPAGVTYVLSNDHVTPPAVEHLTLIAGDDAPRGEFQVVVTGRSGGVSHVANRLATLEIGIVPICYARVTGKVTDSVTHAPIADAAIGSFNGVFTRADGTYSYDTIGLGENNAPLTTSIFADKTGYFRHSADATFICAQTTTVNLELVKFLPAHIHGVVTEGTPDPANPNDVIPGPTRIAGIQVGLLESYPNSGVVTTAADGAYRIDVDHLGPDNTSSSLSLSAYDLLDPPNSLYWGRTGFQLAALDVLPGEDREVDFGMVRKCYSSITGTVRYGDTNALAAGVTVQAGHAQELVTVKTNDLGVYSMPRVLLDYNNQPVNVGVSAFVEGGFYQSANSSTRFETCGENDVVNLVLPPEKFGSVHGTIIDHDTKLPVPGATVDFGFASCPTCDPYPGVAAANGAYRIDKIAASFDPDPVSYGIESTADGYWVEHGPAFDVTNGSDATRNFELVRRRYAALSGTVRDSITKLPIEGAIGGATHIGPGVTTNASGGYSQTHIDVADHNQPFEGAVEFQAPGYYREQLPATFDPDVPAVVNFELVKICDGATIRGRVFDITTQQPVEGASVVVVGNGSDTTDAAGQFEIDHVRVGDHNSPQSVTVVVSKEHYFTQSRSITVFCGASFTMDFAPPIGPGSLHGFVTDSVTGDPIPDVKVVGAFGQETLTDADGHYRFDDISVNDDGSPRAWDVTALPTDFPGKTKSATIRTGELTRVDFAFGGIEPPPPATGHIVVRVDTQPAGSTQSFAYTPSYAAGFALTDGQSNDSGAIEAGKTYSVSQAAVTGWDTTSSCDHGATPASIALVADTTVTCTFHNVQRGSIVINKVAAGGNATFSFVSQRLGNFSIMTVAGTGSRPFTNLVPGSYAVTESSVSGWDPASATCGGGMAPTAITLAAGQTVTCTFTNNKRGSIRITKTVAGSPPTGTQSFPFSLRQGASSTNAGTSLGTGTATAGNAGVVSFTASLVAGAAYQLCETVQPGWSTSLGPNPFTLFDASGDNSVVCADYTVQPGQARTVTIDNRPPPGGLQRTIGFWKNWSSCSKGKQAPTLDRTLASAEPSGITIGRLTLHGSASRPDVAPSCSKAFNLLDKTTIDGKKKSASDPAFNMAAQLLAADLNQAVHAGSCAAASAAITSGQALLYAISFDGLTHAKLTAAQSTQANDLATRLDRYNNGLLC